MKSIRSRLLAMLAVFIIVPYFISVLAIYISTKEKAEKNAYRNMEEQVQKGSEDAGRYLQDMVNLPFILYLNPDLFRIFERGFESKIYTNQLEVDKSFLSFSLTRSEMRQVRFFIAKGSDTFTVSNAKVGTRKQRPDLWNSPSFQQLLKSDSYYLIEPPHSLEEYGGSGLTAGSGQAMVVTIHHKVTDILSNEFLGVVSMDIDLSGFAQICNRFYMAGKDLVVLTDDNGNVIYASDQRWLGKPFTPSAAMSQGDIAISKPLPTEFGQWHLVKVTSSDDLYRDVRQTAYSSAFIGVGVVILGLLMIGYISYKITRPIKQLSQKVRSIEGGNLGVRFDDGGKDEVGHLEKHIKQMMERINRHIEKEYRLEIENKTNQYRAMQSQINPHFLFNALQSIGAVALRSESPQVYQLVTSLSKMMRYTIRMGKWATVRSEVDYVKDYLVLQKERFRVDLHYTISMEESVLDIPVPTMILQPLVENFFKHCFEEGHYDSHLTLRGFKEQEHVILIAENDGPGLSNEELSRLRKKIYEPGNHNAASYERIGLKNIHERLVLNYGSSAGLKVDSGDGRGFAVTLTIPLQPKEEAADESTDRG